MRHEQSLLARLPAAPDATGHAALHHPPALVRQWSQQTHKQINRGALAAARAANQSDALPADLQVQSPQNPAVLAHNGKTPLTDPIRSGRDSETATWGDSGRWSKVAQPESQRYRLLKKPKRCKSAAEQARGVEHPTPSCQGEESRQHRYLAAASTGSRAMQSTPDPRPRVHSGGKRLKICSWLSVDVEDDLPGGRSACT